MVTFERRNNQEAKPKRKSKNKKSEAQRNEVFLKKVCRALNSVRVLPRRSSAVQIRKIIIEYQNAFGKKAKYYKRTSKRIAILQKLLYCMYFSSSGISQYVSASFIFKLIEVAIFIIAHSSMLAKSSIHNEILVSIFPISMYHISSSCKLAHANIATYQSYYKAL